MANSSFLPVNIPSTSLPYYDLASHHDSESKQLNPPKYHSAIIKTVSIAQSNLAIFRAFAAFVAAVTDLEDVAFTAKYPSEGCASILAIASLLTTGKPRSYSSDHIQLSTWPSNETNDIKSDFEIEIHPGHAPLLPSNKAFHLLVIPLDNQNLADLQLSVSARHGHAVLASHLLRLAAKFLASSSADVRPSLSPEPVMSSLNYPPKMWKAPILKSDLHIEQNFPALMHGAFERRVLQFPNRTAVEAVADESFTSRKWTYLQLNADAEGFAEELLLVERTISWAPAFRNQRAILLFLPAGPDFYIAVTAMSKAGFAICSLPLDAPPQRLLDLIQDTKSSVVIGVGSVPFPGIDLNDGSEAAHMLKKLTWIDVHDMTKWRPKNLDLETPLVPHPPTEEDLAYILYTSGSTGKPKGVLISHSMATCGIHGHAEAFEPLPPGPELRWLQFAMPTFDLALMELFVTLGLGGTVCSAERSLMLSDMERAVNFFKATSLFTVASMATLFRPQALPTLTTIVSGGEALTKYAIDNFAHNANWKPNVKPKRVINIYGPTEATMCATSENAALGTRGSIAGSVFSCASVLLVDANNTENLIQVPMGLTGEIVFGGPMVGYGYMNRPEETARAFTSGLGLGPVYRTGDKGRIVFSSEGEPKLEILGRLNMEQVKLNSRRVELGEIESTIAKVDAVREVATVVVNGSFLVAYISLRQQHTSQNAIAECRTAAEQGLPGWMRPVEYNVVPSIPRTSSGKVDRKVLQKMALQNFDGSCTQKPATVTADSYKGKVDLEDAASVANMLKHTLIGVLGRTLRAENFEKPLTSLGLDSLRSMKLLQELRRQGVEGLAIKNVLVDKTFDDVVRSIMQIHAGLEEGDVTESDDELVEIENEEDILSLPLAAKLKHFDHSCRPKCMETLKLPSEEIAEIIPATGVQTRMLASIDESHGMLKVSKPWIEHYPYLVPDNIDSERLERAVIGALQKRDAFRAVWVEVEHPLAPFAQCVLSPSSPRAALPIVRINCPVYDEDPTSLWRQTVDNAQRSAEAVFGLHSLCSVTTFIRSGDGKRCVIVFSLHHTIYDGLSLQALSRDIAAMYRKKTPKKVTLGVRFPVEEHLKSDWLATGLFWAQRLAGANPFKVGSRLLPTLPENNFVAINTNAGTASESLECAFSARDLFSTAQSQNLSSPMAMIQAAWSMTLVQTLTDPCDKYEISFGSVFHGRHTAASLDAFALMLDCLPTRIVFEQDRKLSHRDICSQMFTQYTNALGFTEMPCPSVQFARATRRFDSSIILQTLPDDKGDDVLGLPCFSRVHDGSLPPWKETSADMPILVELWPGKNRNDDKLSIRCSYSQLWPGYEFMTPRWIQGLLTTFNKALVRVITNPDSTFDPNGLC